MFNGVAIAQYWRHLRASATIGRLIKFCVVGASGFLVDNVVLYLLVDPAWRGWEVTLSKLCSAEAALINNFIWNELWTFRFCGSRTRRGVVHRLWRFHLICAIGIGLAALLLHVFYGRLGIGLLIANALAIILVTLWTFSMNALFNWRV